MTAMMPWAMALALVLFSRSAQASTGAEENPFGGAFASLSATMMATFDLAQSKVEAPSQPATKESAPEAAAPSWLMAGFCDVRGASGVAPLPALPVQDGSVAADTSSCQENTLRGGNSVERGKTKGVSSPAEATEPALLPPTFQVRVWGQLRELPRSGERLDALPRGFARGIEEPPRG